MNIGVEIGGGTESGESSGSGVVFASSAERAAGITDSVMSGGGIIAGKSAARVSSRVLGARASSLLGFAGMAYVAFYRERSEQFALLVHTPKLEVT